MASLRTKLQTQRDAWRARNRAVEVAQTAIWRAKNRDRHRAMIAKWKAENKPRTLANTRFRQAQKLKATPPWLTEEDRECMVQLYICAKMLRDCGFPTEVDHVIPLLGKTVSGLHVPWNLQLLSTAANRAKSNRVD